MSKAIFRWLRGELNGYYITNLYNTFNKSTEDIKKFLIDFNNMKFEEGKIDNDTLYNIGKFAGVFLPRTSKIESLTSIRMSDTKEVDGIEYSERGLFYKPTETFHYYHLNIEAEGGFKYPELIPDTDINEQSSENLKSSLVGDEEVKGYLSEKATDVFNSDGTINMSKVTSTPPSDVAFNRIYGDNFSFLSEGTNDVLDRNIRLTLSEDGSSGLYMPPAPDYADINTLATEEERSSLVGDEDIIGYISENEVDVIDDNGNVRLSKVTLTPPEEGAYSDFYGNQFLFLSEGDVVYEAVEPSLFLELYKALQWIRYNGDSMKSLVTIIDIICPKKTVTIDRFELGVDGIHFNLYYNYDDTTDVSYKQQRLSMLEYIISLKFKQIILIENEIN